MEFTLKRYYLETVCTPEGARELPREERITYRHSPGVPAAVGLPVKLLERMRATHLSNEWVAVSVLAPSFTLGERDPRNIDPLFMQGGAPPRRGVVYLSTEQYESAMAATAIGGI